MSDLNKQDQSDDPKLDLESMVDRDVTTPRQDYLHGHGWPAMLLLPRRSWPDLEVLWDTIQVEQFNLREAFRSNSHSRIARQDLLPFAKQALNAALNGEP